MSQGFTSSAFDTVSAANSTTTPLAGGAAFTGTSTSTIGFSAIEVVVYANVASAASGVLIEFSSDGTNWDDSSPFTFTPGSVGPNQGQAFICAVRAQYFRVVYTNGGSAQATFRLQSVLKQSPITGDVISVNGTLNGNNHGLLTVSQIVGLTTAGGGGYVPVKVNPSGALVTAPGSSSTTGAQTSQAASATSVTLLAANTARLGATIYNDDTVNTGTTIYVRLSSSAASTTNYTVQLLPQAYYEVPFGYAGTITAIWSSAATGNARITELT